MAINSALLDHEEKEIRKFYQIIYLLSSLSIMTGDRIKYGLPAEQDWFSLSKFRRDIADALAYISAYAKDTDSVTAVALGKEDGKVVVWIAANQKVKAKVVGFLTEVLGRLDDIAQSPESEREDDIFDFVLDFNQMRIFRYYRNFCGIWTEIKNRQPSPSNGALINLDMWIQTTFHKDGKELQPEDMAKLARKCHRARERDVGMFEMLKQFSTQSNMLSQEYERLHKLLYKIGKHITLCRKLIDARRSLPEDFKQGAVVKAVYVTAKSPVRLQRKCSLDSIAAVFFPSDTERRAFHDHIDKFYNREGVSQKLQIRLNSCPRVHAEIQLINHFDRHNCQLLDESNPYIGCSKPACYLCYKYITHHPRRWFRPPSHQKLYHAWCLPEPPTHDNRKDFLAATVEMLQSQLRAEIENQRGPRIFHADSTAGATSTINTRLALFVGTQLM
ncbi:hypothetical protein BDV29DRAFT_197576 [Aspergillus leporis]|uniref:Uncharacterized protein n=1 Tax=Aspergillus leporis TaxID=41062 RepID=A0A5N5WTY6_9EURO|nr:hypothetical protein BDV29DRAFT_197576 [Aspergillus leporis]